MPVDHPHVGAIAVEPNELVCALAQASVIVSGDAHIRFKPREAAGAAGETFWNRLHLKSPNSPYAKGPPKGLPPPSRLRPPSSFPSRLGEALPVVHPQPRCMCTVRG